MDNAENAYESKLRECKVLVEKWSGVSHEDLPGVISPDEGRVNVMEGIESERKRMLVAQLLENVRKQIYGMDEATRMTQIGSYEKFIFPVIRAAYANLVLDELVSVQPMDARVGMVFYMDAIFDSTKGSVSRGDRMFHATAGPSDALHYADEVVDAETVGTGNGSTSSFSGNLSWLPIIPGTVEFGDGSQEVSDDGNGNLQGDCYSGGTINYVTGAYSFQFLSAPADGATITAAYQYNSECVTPPAVAIQLTSSPVVARPHRLSAEWCVEAAQDLKSYHGMDAEAEITSFAANEIQKEICYTVINQLYQSAGAGNVTWSRTPATGVQWYYHKKSFIDTILTASGNIFQATQRDQATWMCCGVSVGTLLKGMEEFKPSTVPSGTVGMRYIGDLVGIKVYECPFMSTNNFLLGRKGTSALDTGFIYAPYLGLFTTPTIMLQDMKARKGMMLSAAKKMTDSGQFATGQVVA